MNKNHLYRPRPDSLGGGGDEASIFTPPTDASSCPLENGLPLEVHLGRAASMEASRNLFKEAVSGPTWVWVECFQEAEELLSCVSVGLASGQAASEDDQVGLGLPLVSSQLLPLAPAPPIRLLGAIGSSHSGMASAPGGIPADKAAQEVQGLSPCLPRELSDPAFWIPPIYSPLPGGLRMYPSLP